MKDIPLYDVRRICDLKDMRAASVERFGDNPAFLRKKDPSAAYEPVSFRRFQSDVNACGTALLDLGLQGRRIAVIGENQYAWVTTDLAVVNGAGIIVPIDRELPEEEIIRCPRRTQVRTAVLAESKREVMHSIAGKIDQVLRKGNGFDDQGTQSARKRRMSVGRG
jgi:long-chain acyl-CoA synthetase